MEARPAQFSDLPVELRLMVWKATFDHDEGVAWPWMTRFIDMDALENPEYPNPFWIPLALPVALSINAESRAVAQTWINEQGARFQERGRLTWPSDLNNKDEEEKETPSPSLSSEQEKELILVRSLDLTKDYVYVPRTRHEKAKYIIEAYGNAGPGWVTIWKEFNMTKRARIRMMRTSAETLALVGARHLALPAFTAYYSLDWLTHAVEETEHLDKVYVIWDELPAPDELPFSKLEAIKEWESMKRSDDVGLEEEETEDNNDNDNDGGIDEDDGKSENEGNPGISVEMIVEDGAGGPGIAKETGDLKEWMDEISEELLEVYASDEPSSALTGSVGSFPTRNVNWDRRGIPLEFVPVRVRK